jgi:hypothetical protein
VAQSSSTSGNRRRREGVLVTAVGAMFVIIGVAVGGPWYATAFFAFCMLAGVLMIVGILPREMPPDEHLTIDDEGITRTARKLREHVAWTDIERVRILTTDQGPQTEDVFFVIDGKNGTGCMVSQELATRGKLLEALQARLDGVNNAAVIEAMMSVENKVFTIWERKS